MLENIAAFVVLLLLLLSPILVGIAAAMLVWTLGLGGDGFMYWLIAVGSLIYGTHLYMRLTE